MVGAQKLTAPQLADDTPMQPHTLARTAQRVLCLARLVGKGVVEPTVAARRRTIVGRANLSYGGIKAIPARAGVDGGGVLCHGNNPPF